MGLPRFFRFSIPVTVASSDAYADDGKWEAMGGYTAPEEKVLTIRVLVESGSYEDAESNLVAALGRLAEGKS